MCDTGNLIDLTGWDEPVEEETKIEPAHAESVLVESFSYNEPYDPFDLLEKEACFKGLNIDSQIQHIESPADTQLQYADQDLYNETPPVAMEFLPTNSDSSGGNSKRIDSRQQSLQKQLVKLKAAKLSCINTPPHQHSGKYQKHTSGGFAFDDLQMISAESPVKFIEDEPSPISASTSAHMSELSDDTCSNSEFEARLKMLRIAMLDSPATTDSKKELPAEQHTTAAGSNLAGNTPEIGQLMLELKAFCNHVDAAKRQQFDALLESLNRALMPSPRASQPDKDSPHTYTRQATFDLDLAQQAKRADSAEHTQAANRAVQEFPDAMTCSSATYDGESLASERPDVVLPKVSPDISLHKPDAYLTEVVNENLALQINELLERHKQHGHDSSHNETKSGGGQTVILLVNSTVGNQLPSCIVHPSTTGVSKAAAESARASSLRRRSSSLSIHDKAKQDRARSLVKQSSGDSSHSASSQCMPLKELSTVVDKTNAMSALRQRRNSFSIGLTAGKAAAARATLDGRRQASAINESMVKPKAPIPIKRVVPMVKSAEASHLNTTTASRCSQGQDTPMTSRTKPGGKLFCTSTPMPQMRAQPRRSLRPLSGYGSSTATATSSNVRAASYAKKAAP